MRSMVEGARPAPRWTLGAELVETGRGSPEGACPALPPSTAFGGPPPPLRGGGSVMYRKRDAAPIGLCRSVALRGLHLTRHGRAKPGHDAEGGPPRTARGVHRRSHGSFPCFGGRGDVKDGPKARRLRRSRSLTSPLPPKNPHPCARPDSVYFDAAIEHILRRTTFVSKWYEEGHGYIRSYDIIRYTDKNEFVMSNPGCCAIIPHIPSDRAEHLFGPNARTVSMNVHGQVL